MHVDVCIAPPPVPYQDRVVSTEPPEVQRFGMTMTQWDLYDSYMAEYARVQVG